MTQSRGQYPEHLPARNKQTAPACRFTADGATPKYGANIMSIIFILGLEDTHTCEQLHQRKPEQGKTTIGFETMVDAASEISTAKDKGRHKKASFFRTLPKRGGEGSTGIQNF